MANDIRSQMHDSTGPAGVSSGMGPTSNKTVDVYVCFAVIVRVQDTYLTSKKLGFKVQMNKGSCEFRGRGKVSLLMDGFYI